MKIRVAGITLVLLGIVIGSVCTYFILKERCDAKDARNAIGKSFNFVVDQNDTIHADALRRILENVQNHPIQLLSSTEADKLVQFMDKNNFVIAPGNYVLNQTDGFEQLLLKLYLGNIEGNP